MTLTLDVQVQFLIAYLGNKWPDCSTMLPRSLTPPMIWPSKLWSISERDWSSSFGTLMETANGGIINKNTIYVHFFKKRWYCWLLCSQSHLVLSSLLSPYAHITTDLIRLRYSFIQSKEELPSYNDGHPSTETMFNTVQNGSCEISYAISAQIVNIGRML